MGLKYVSDAVYIAEDKIVCFTKNDIAFLKERLRQTGLKRIRICAHKNTEDTLQEMLIAFEKGSYIRPSKHLNKEESIHVLEGTGTFVFFDEQGNITHAIPVGDPTTGRQEYLRTPTDTYHTLLITSDTFVVQETTEGPFRRSDTVFAKWGPEEQHPSEVEAYMSELSKRIAKLNPQKP